MDWIGFLALGCTGHFTMIISQLYLERLTVTKNSLDARIGDGVTEPLLGPFCIVCNYLDQTLKFPRSSVLR
jgi:hypothetical protein